MYCDSIIYIDGGVIKEQGSHRELMELNGEYSKLYLSQTEANTGDSAEVRRNG
jgi:ABC-type multidrug transport system fused ATPase/permease subunit